MKQRMPKISKRSKSNDITSLKVWKEVLWLIAGFLNMCIEVWGLKFLQGVPQPLQLYMIYGAATLFFPSPHSLKANLKIGWGGTVTNNAKYSLHSAFKEQQTGPPSVL